MLLFLLLIAGIVILDQGSKWLIVANMELYESITVIPGVLNFTYIPNDGAAFGMLDDHRWVFMILSTVAIVGLLIFLWKKPPQSKFCSIAITFLIGGGIGNMIDRCLLGYVIDFIDFCAFPKLWMWIFNVADSFVTVGTFMLVGWLLYDIIREFRMERAGAGVQSDASETKETTERAEAKQDADAR